MTTPKHPHIDAPIRILHGENVYAVFAALNRYMRAGGLSATEARAEVAEISNAATSYDDVFEVAGRYVNVV